MYLCTYVCKGRPFPKWLKRTQNLETLKPPNPLSKVYEKRALRAAGVIFVIRALLGLKTMCQIACEEKVLYMHKYIST